MVGWIHRVLFLERSEDVAVGTCSGNTQLSLKHDQMTVMFLVHMMVVLNMKRIKRRKGT